MQSYTDQAVPVCVLATEIATTIDCTFEMSRFLLILYVPSAAVLLVLLTDYKSQGELVTLLFETRSLPAVYTCNNQKIIVQEILA